MYEHMVFFKFYDSLTKEKEQEFLEKLHSLKGLIPGIAELTCGINVTEENDKCQGFTLGLRISFVDKNALNAYGPHPAHQEFVQSLDGFIEDVIVVDYPM